MYMEYSTLYTFYSNIVYWMQIDASPAFIPAHYYNSWLLSITIYKSVSCTFSSSFIMLRKYHAFELALASDNNCTILFMFAAFILLQTYNLTDFYKAIR